MLGRYCRLIWFLLALILAPRVVMAQEPSPQALATAKELVEAMHLTDQFKGVIPGVIKTLKPSIVQGRAEVDRQYDAITPALIDAFQARLAELSDAMAIIYARNFSADELNALIAFYKTPIGQKLLQKMPSLAQESMTVGSKFGRSVGVEVQQRLIDELRKKGVNL